ncbi:hypothetical protein ACRQ1B_00070 [Rhizobium panacihumi]|uniref:hypothetical protein n=1 Tax=Rhizobium panacihumi TaxID=2008450 RepID=UPI003D7BA2E3
MIFARSIIVVAMSVLMPLPLMAAQGDDPDWPCIQRKVPQLSIGQIWTGPALSPVAAEWSRDADLAELVEELAARRLPLAEAQEKIRAFRDGQKQEQWQRRVDMLVQGLFETMNGERAHVISGIARYAHRQRDMAASLRAEGSALDLLRAKPGADQVQIAVRSEQLTFRTRIFQERVQSLAYVCEVPTLIEQRLYALVKVLSEGPTPK